MKAPHSQVQDITKKKRKRRKKVVKPDDAGDGSEWQTVTRKDKRKYRESPQQKHEEEKDKCASDVPRTGEGPRQDNRPQKRKPTKTRRHAAPRRDSRALVRQQWREDTVEVTVAVAPKWRQHVIGPRGDTIRQLRQAYPAVRVVVPLPQDLTSRHVTLAGPRSQVAAAARDIAHRLEAVKALIHEAATRRAGSRLTVLLSVAPSMRRHLVGSGGERLVRLVQEHPGVAVRVPPAADTHTRTVTVCGPPEEVAAVETCLKATLQAVQRQRELRKEFRKAGKRRPSQKATHK